MLIFVATPIGNLEDLSPRALQALQKADLILCEDTRKSQILLSRYGLKKSLLSYHKFNEKKALPKILALLETGKQLVLISDAGTPCINDPGQLLADTCAKQNIPFTAIPGPCSPIQALLLSGFPISRFQCIGFLPKKPDKALLASLFYPGVTIAFESPQRLVATLRALDRLAPDRQVAVAREMTKVFEECRRGFASELLRHYEAHPPKGEIALVLAEGKLPSEEFPLEELIPLLQERHALSLKEAIKLAASLRNEPKSKIYQKIHR